MNSGIQHSHNCKWTEPVKIGWQLERVGHPSYLNWGHIDIPFLWKEVFHKWLRAVTMIILWESFFIHDCMPRSWLFCEKVSSYTIANRDCDYFMEKRKFFWDILKTYHMIMNMEVTLLAKHSYHKPWRKIQSCGFWWKKTDSGFRLHQNKQQDDPV